MAFLLGFPSTLLNTPHYKPLPLQYNLRTKHPYSLSFSPFSISPISQTPVRLLLHNSFAISSSTPALENPVAESQEQNQQEQPIPNKKRLIAYNVPWTSTLDDIKTLFEKHGTVEDVELSMYNKTKNRGLAFITMGSEEEALAALSNLDSSEVGGRVIKVEFARSLKKQPSSGNKGPVTKYNVFVGNLTWRVRSSDLREFFSDANGVVSAEIVYQTNPRRPAGYGFVSFASKEDAEAAITAFNGKNLLGRSVRLGFSKKQAADIKKESPVDDPV